MAPLNLVMYPFAVDAITLKIDVMDSVYIFKTHLGNQTFGLNLDQTFNMN